MDYEKDPTNQKLKKLNKLRDNLIEGIEYYKNLFANDHQYFVIENEKIQTQLNTYEKELTILQN